MRERDGKLQPLEIAIGENAGTALRLIGHADKLEQGGCLIDVLTPCLAEQ